MEKLFRVIFDNFVVYIKYCFGLSSETRLFFRFMILFSLDYFVQLFFCTYDDLVCCS
jgi:hypothetical protein